MFLHFFNLINLNYLINYNADIGVCLTSSDDFEVIKMNNKIEENNEIIDLDNEKNKNFF